MTIKSQTYPPTQPLDILKDLGDFSLPSPAARIDLQIDLQSAYVHLEDSNLDGKHDKLKFAKDITFDNIDSSFAGDDLVIQFENIPGEKVTLKYWKTEKNRINEFEFYDGTKLSTGEFLNTLGTSDHDLIKWYESGLEINTKEGHDKIYLGSFKHKVYSGAGDDYIEVFPGGSGTFSGEGGHDTIIVNSLPTYESKVFGGAGHDKMTGGMGNETFFGDDDDDTLEGKEGKDNLYGGKGRDTLIGGRDDDVMAGGDDDDTYIYNLGDGNDIIADTAMTDAPSNDVLVLGHGITRQNIKIYIEKNDVVFITSVGEELRIRGHTNPRNKIEQIVFNDGTQTSSTDIVNIIQNMAAYGRDNAISLSHLDYDKPDDGILNAIAYNFQESA